jgi:hypothetical protein
MKPGARRDAKVSTATDGRRLSPLRIGKTLRSDRSFPAQGIFGGRIRLALMVSSRADRHHLSVPDVAEALAVPYKTAVRMLDRVW